jgi:hypothetical protein
MYNGRVAARRDREKFMKLRHLVKAAVLLALAVPTHAFAQSTSTDIWKNPGSLVGLPASDVLGSEDIWENPTFVGGVINGGPSASSVY